jgi:ABC-type transport system substrate-binding protein
MSDIAASGYIAKARPQYLDDRDVIAASVFDNDTRTTYEKSYDVDQAKEILADHCNLYKGEWYTKTAPSGFADENATMSGVNVKLGGWDLIVPQGWTDCELQVSTLMQNLAAIGIQSFWKPLDFDTYLDKRDAFDYDIMHYVMGPKISEPVHQILNWWTGAPAERWSNTSGWVNPTFVTNAKKFETSQEGSTEEKDAAKVCQQELAKSMPSIPFAVNGFWYAVNKNYWTGWPTSSTAKFQPITVWSNSNIGLLQRVILGLSKAGASADAPVLPVIVAFAGIAVALLFARKHKKE